MGPLLADVIYLENEILVVSPFCSDKYWGCLFVVLFCLGYVVVVVVLVCVFLGGVGLFVCLGGLVGLGFLSVPLIGNKNFVQYLCCDFPKNLSLYSITTSFKQNFTR